MRPCESCGKPLPDPCSPLKRFCNDSCRKRGHRLAGGKPKEPERLPGRMERATLAELEKAGATESVAGVAALLLAARLDLQRDTGSAMTSMARELQELLESATGASRTKPADGDRVDELREWRERRHAARR